MMLLRRFKMAPQKRISQTDIHELGFYCGKEGLVMK